MKALRKLLAICLTGLALIGPVVLPATAQADPGYGHTNHAATHYAVYYRWSDGSGPWVLYGAYDDELTAYNVSNWLLANWPYQTFIWTY